MTEAKSVKGTLQTISRTGGLMLKDSNQWYNPASEQAKTQVQDDYRGKQVEIFLQNGSSNYISVYCQQQEVDMRPAAAIVAPEKNLKAEMPAEFIKNLQGKEFITHQGLLWMAHHKGLKEIKTELVGMDPVIFKASVTMKDGSLFQAYGDATDDNVNSQIRLHKIRMAETRALNRALRLATNLGMTSLEELGGDQ